MSMVSVIIPAFNSEETIARSLRSVLLQEYTDVQIVVVDDGSTDSTASVVASIDDHRITYIKQDNCGPAAARNRGVSASTAEWIAFLDADDEWCSTKLAKQLEYMTNNNLVACVTDVLERNSLKGDYLCRKPDLINKSSEEIVDLIYRGKMTRNTPTLMVRRSAFLQAGGFDQELRNREDHHLLCKLAFLGSLGNISRPLTVRHVVMSSYSRSYDPYRYFLDTLIFHNKMKKSYPFLNISAGIIRTKNLAIKRALTSRSFSDAVKILVARPKSDL